MFFYLRAMQNCIKNSKKYNNCSRSSKTTNVSVSFSNDNISHLLGTFKKSTFGKITKVFALPYCIARGESDIVHYPIVITSNKI